MPLVTKPLNLIDDVRANTFREKKEKVYAQIVADLTDVTTSPLPDKQPAANQGRVSKVAGNASAGTGVPDHGDDPGSGQPGRPTSLRLKRF